ncbi:hypothetical protein NDU88_007127 [Pleurodeles waltl]|uniref:Uncharacterized protein n=1 Tax=Pleurodeles waltl TaxID=8319 RepID=A0AAV7LR53_PLEWA|nr:hypothetical protein NDU88_007127 [Pleurodeles waltl]
MVIWRRRFKDEWTSVVWLCGGGGSRMSGLAWYDHMEERFKDEWTDVLLLFNEKPRIYSESRDQRRRGAVKRDVEVLQKEDRRAASPGALQSRRYRGPWVFMFALPGVFFLFGECRRGEHRT